MTKVMSKTATSDMIRVIVGQEFSFKENMTGERNGVNRDRSTDPASAVMRSASRGGVVMVSPWVVFGGLRRAHCSPSPPNVELADGARLQRDDNVLDFGACLACLVLYCRAVSPMTNRRGSSSGLA
jgi:hypothetical protein